MMDWFIETDLWVVAVAWIAFAVLVWLDGRG